MKISKIQRMHTIIGALNTNIQSSARPICEKSFEIQLSKKVLDEKDTIIDERNTNIQFLGTIIDKKTSEIQHLNK